MLTPYTIVSLWELMDKFDASNVVAVCAGLTQVMQVASTDQRNGQIPNDLKARTQVVLGASLFVCTEAGLDESIAMICRLSEQYKTPVQSAELQHTLHGLLRLMQSEMEKKLFFVLQPSDAKHYGQEKPFGAAVFDAFPSARLDAAEAWNCLALNRPTAAVFHAMCVLEPGLGALAADVNVKVGSNAWKTIIDQIEKAIRIEEAALPKGSEKNARLRFLSEAAKEFFYFKEGWRNHVAHARVHYEEPDALSALNHVGSFMQKLASRLHE